MVTPRPNLIRRVMAALDASPSRIPVLLGGCGSGRTTILHQLRERLGRTGAQYLDVERTATTPERFLRAVVASSPAAAVGPGQQAPTWAQLSPGNRQVLAPLASEWDSFDPQRKQKWLGIANHYPMLAPVEQQRVQQQMSAWAHLTPEQRQLARQQYKNLRQVPPEQRQQVAQKWHEYQQLPPEKRREFAARGAAPHRRP